MFSEKDAFFKQNMSIKSETHLFKIYKDVQKSSKMDNMGRA